MRGRAAHQEGQPSNAGHEQTASSGVGDLRLQLSLKRRAEQRKAEALGRAASSGGSALGDGERARLEPRLGASLDGVRIHTGAASQEAARAIGAKAYTVGNDIHFAAGQYQPGTAEGERLLAHELVHTRQQAKAGASAVATKLEVSEPGDACEREADEIADRVVSGRAAGPAMARPPSVARTAVIQREPDPAAQHEAGRPPSADADDKADEKADDKGGDEKDEGPIARLEVHADVETVDRTKLTYDELQQARVGHACISDRIAMAHGRAFPTEMRC
jgi:hypothetical protein